jgi:peptidyl-tRNA hydrolase
MYLIVKESILPLMTLGKTCAQVAHASQMLMSKYLEIKNRLFNNAVEQGVNNDPDKSLLLQQEAVDLFQKLDSFDEWLKQDVRKIVLKANDREFELLKQEDHVLVVDAGYTCLDLNTETVIGLFPMYKSKRSNLLKSLKSL